ncbi:thiamine pyrophosphokinase [Candidatus Poribacteria bacterium]|nr:thiamine pyrophosphokinase [Candidatus Poribacteria bacterium]
MTANPTKKKISLRTAFVFLSGFYDDRYYDFYRQQIEDAKANKHLLICANGGLAIFQSLNEYFDTTFFPNIVIGDLDSVKNNAALIENFSGKGTRFVVEWIGKVDKDYTDGQLAVAYAMQEYGCMNIVMFGGLNDTRSYESDHFLGNLKLMRFGFHKVAAEDKRYRVCMRDPLQEIHFVVDSITLQRKSYEINRVSLFTEYENTVVAESQNLRWPLHNFRIDPDEPNALRNEFVKNADTASIKLCLDSEPVYVIHNWCYS